MKKFFLKLFKWLFCCSLILVVLAVAALLYFLPNCDGDSPQAEYARSIPKERLETLFNQLQEIQSTHELKTEKFRAKYDIDFPLPINFSYEEAPSSLRDLEFKNVRITERHSRIMLEGCLDHFLTLNVQGLFGKKTPKIALSWGEFEPGYEVLWEK